MFSVIRDAQNVELSQGSITKKSKILSVDPSTLKLSTIVNFDASHFKEREWDNIITCHSNESFVKTWNFQRKAIGNNSLESKDGSPVKAVKISACGNFAFIGSAAGQIDKYNMQSGLYRQSMVGHSKAVQALACDDVNLLLISGSLDCSIKFWDFKTCKLLETITLPACVSLFKLYDSNRLLAVVTDDMIIRIIDIDTKKIVREFIGHTNRITGLTFSPDGRWVISSSLDMTIRTWDLPTGFLIDIFKTNDICTDITMSPLGDFLATTHVNQVGIFLWANRSLYEHCPIRQINDSDVRQVLLPLSDGSISESLNDQEAVFIDFKDDFDWMSKDESLISFSNLPKSRWHNLLNLDSIKVK
jgi:U3 small nucleolar RNA-associated protein 21